MNFLKKHTIKIVWFIFLITYVFSYFIFIQQASLGPLIDVLFAAIFVAGLAAWIYLTVRVGYVRRHLANCMRRLLNNDYKTGINEALWLGDEVSELAVLANKTVAQLQIYDQLRVDRIGLFRRLVDLISENVAEGIILVDVERKVLLFNTTAQKIFGIEQEKLTFDSVERQENNKQFLAMFKDLIDNGKVIDTCTVDLQLPIKNARKKVCLRMLPLKDKTEKVQLAVIFVSPA